MQRTTRKPTGKASFPLVLLAGVEGAGKTWAAVEATAMEEVDRAFFLEIGESQADAYGAIPGADFEIVEHDGTVGDIRQALQWVNEQPHAEGKYNLLIVDSVSELWTLLADNAQDEANRRATKKGRRIPEGGAQITMDLWNTAKDSWNGLLNQLRRFPGPVLLTSRLELVTALDGSGQPTQDKQWKIKAEKNLPYHAQVVLQARQPRKWVMTKIATTVPELQLQPGGEMPFNEFAVPLLLRTMGIGPDAPASTFVPPRVDGELSDERLQALAAQEEAAARERVEAQKKAQAEAYRQSQIAGLEAAEKAGDMQKIAKARDYYASQGQRELAKLAAGVLDRMAKANLAEETGAEVVEGEVVNPTANAA